MSSLLGDSMKKKILIILSIIAVIILVITFVPPIINCGDSEIYTKQERQVAADLIADTIRSFEGCKLYAVLYEGDPVSEKNLEYCNELAKEGTVYADCIVFTSYFRSPIFGGGAWNANEIYSWSWYLARTDDGDWEILTYGYA